MTNFLSNLSPRGVRVLYTIAALVVLSVCLLNFMYLMVYNVPANDECAWRPIKGRDNALLITDVVPGGVTDKAGIKDGDILLKINGKDFKNNAAQPLINAVPLGDYATYLVERAGAQFETKVQILRVFNIAYLALFLLGFGFLVVGYVVVMTKPEGQIQRMFARYSILSMALFGLFFPDIRLAQDPLWKSVLILSGVSISRILAPPMFVRFFFYFPVRKKTLEKKWLTWSLYIVSCILLGMLVLSRGTLSVIGLIGFFGPFLFYISGLLVFAHSYFRNVDGNRRRQLRPILISVIIGVAGFLYFLFVNTTNPFAIFLNPLLFLPGVLVVVVPMAFGYSIFRYRLMDIELIVKRSLFYGSVTATMAAIYLLTVYGVGNLIGYFLGAEDNRTLNILALVLVALAFDPLKRRIQEMIDRLFYRERHDYQKALLEFSQELPRQMNLEQILNSMVNRISGTMHVEKVAVVLCDTAEGCYSISKNIPKECCVFVEEEDSLISLLRKSKRAQSFALLGEESDSVRLNEMDKQKILASKIVLAVPMFLQDRMIGTINVGPKLSGKIYSKEDIDLLSTVASQAAIAIGNARLHQSVIEKKKIEEELSIARRIQQGLLPKSNPSIEGLDISGIAIPALNVGGDYFDFIQLGPKKILIVVADVSGKGMSAALYMSKIQGMIQLAAHMYKSPKEMLIEVNRRIYDGLERNSFITMILALIDLETHEVKICRAGHNKALVSTNGNLHYISGSGIGLGLEPGPIFERSLEEIIQPLNNDGLFVFYSDGLTEAMNKRQTELGDENGCILVTSNKHLPAREIQNAIISAVKAFQGSAEQHDDLTLVVVKSKTVQHPAVLS